MADVGAAMNAELQLPDLPDKPGPLGPARGAPPRLHTPWLLRLREAIASFLPLLLMAALALASWWLVKNAPRPLPPAVSDGPRGEPDTVMQRFALERFDADGRLAVRIEGEQMRHYANVDRIEIDGVRIRALSLDGRVTEAHAQRALAAGDGSEAQLLGGAEVASTDAAGVELLMRGEFLHAFFLTEQVRSHLPVQVRHGGSEMRAAGLHYDHVAQRLDLAGPMRGQFPARAQPR
jgi:lipopolysaccharide export system protein LptC